MEKIDTIFDAVFNDHPLGITLDQPCSRTRKLIGQKKDRVIMAQVVDNREKLVSNLV